VALSTCETEYYSATDATREVIHLRQLIGEILNAPNTETTTIWEDNQSTTAYSQNAMVSDKTKHIVLKFPFFQYHVEKGIVRPVGENRPVGVFLLNMNRWTRLFNARGAHLLRSSNTYKQCFCEMS
jgi:hypothetical protein